MGEITQSVVRSPVSVTCVSSQASSAKRAADNEAKALRDFLGYDTQGNTQEDTDKMDSNEDTGSELSDDDDSLLDNWTEQDLLDIKKAVVERVGIVAPDEEHINPEVLAVVIDEFTKKRRLNQISGVGCDVNKTVDEMVVAGKHKRRKTIINSRKINNSGFRIDSVASMRVEVPEVDVGGCLVSLLKFDPVADSGILDGIQPRNQKDQGVGFRNQLKPSSLREFPTLPKSPFFPVGFHARESVAPFANTSKPRQPLGDANVSGHCQLNFANIVYSRLG